MLLTSQERFQFRVLSLLSLNNEKSSSIWRLSYDKLYSDQKIDIEKRVEKDPEYKKMLDYRSYSDSPSSQVYFSRNVPVHINDDRQCVCPLIYLSITIIIIGWFSFNFLLPISFVEVVCKLMLHVAVTGREVFQSFFFFFWVCLYKSRLNLFSNKI